MEYDDDSVLQNTCACRSGRIGPPDRRSCSAQAALMSRDKLLDVLGLRYAAVREMQRSRVLQQV